ncbi:hypothetical protein KEM52_002618, partial [Ascosphaera acerosa]
ATIPRTLVFLFNSLELPLCDRVAAKSISTLCQSCRTSLTVYVGDFIDKFNALRAQAAAPATHAAPRPPVSVATLERVAEGIAAIARAMPAEVDQARCLMTLLLPFEALAKQALAMALAQHDDPEEALRLAVMVMRCTASIGKGFRSQDDEPVTLDGDDDGDDGNAGGSAAASAARFWGPGGPGGPAQACIMSILRTLVATFAADGDIIEATCDILRAGYTESQPGPYVLPAQASVEFVRTAAAVSAPRFAAIMATAT